jgi:type I restriction enzyme, S subunit
MKHIPILRFSEFDGEWQTNTLGEIFNISVGGDISNELVQQTKDDIFKYPIYANSEKNKGLYGYSNIYKVEENVVTVTGRGNIGIAHARNHKFYPIVRLLVLLSKDLANIYFFEYQINRLNLFKETTGVPQLTAPQLSNYNISYPQFAEQQKIGSFIVAIDDKIQCLQKKKKLLEAYKKGMMQRIFSQAFRFNAADGTDFPNWENKRLGAAAEINPKNKNIPNSFIYIDLESVVAGQLLKETILEIHHAPSRAQRVLKRGDILFQMVRPYQKNNLYFDKDGDYVASTGYAQIRTNHNAQFIFQYLHFQQFVDKVIEKCTGTSYPAINSTDLSNIVIELPCAAEQTKIANFLCGIDAKIAICAQQITQTITYKQGLLQRMFV